MRLFKSVLDGLGYILLLIIAPASQATIYLLTKDPGFYISAIIMAICLLYDCYTRFDNGMSKKDKFGIFIIGTCAFTMLLGVFAIKIFEVAGITSVYNWGYWLFSPLILPFVLAIYGVIEKFFTIVKY